MERKKEIYLILLLLFLLIFPLSNTVFANGIENDDVITDEKSGIVKQEKTINKKSFDKAVLVDNRLKSRAVNSDGNEPLRNFSISTSKGIKIHQTDNEVINLETIDACGFQIYLWQEQDGFGKFKKFYAVISNGAILNGRVRKADYLIKLKNRVFDPMINQDFAIDRSLESKPDSRLFLVQFVSTPIPGFREELTKLGVKPLKYIPGSTFLVEMSPSAGQNLSNLPYVRWIGSYHPAYRLDKTFLDSIIKKTKELPKARYSIVLCEKSKERQNRVAELIEKLNGVVDLVEPAGLRVEASLTQEQLVAVANSNDVIYVDLWGGPGETDMNIVREVGGGNVIETQLGFTGQGVNGEIFDTELRTSHQEWPVAPLIHSTGSGGTSYHGTSCYSNNFAAGTQANARGMLPDGQGIFFKYSESTQFGGAKSRYDINDELTDPAGPYRAVFQTSSVGSSRTESYTSVSVEVDDYLFDHPILSTQSQSNAGTRMSRPQAWAKNIVSVGGIRHGNTATRTDDYWGSGASIGPAADGRIKPDLAFFYDSIYSAKGSGDSAYTEFGGTSAATPETAGHFGILFQMWHEGVWTGHGGGSDVFDNRPEMATAKALMINTAYRYDWNSGGSNSDINRYVQGWGTPDLQNLNNKAAGTTIIDETDLLLPLGTNSYDVNVASGSGEFNITMVYTDPAGTASAAVHRINDLSLRVTSPGGVVYWGNNGLTASNYSTSGGSSNTLDTVENVFIANPEAGTWKVDIIGDEIVEDAHVETPEIDADYALVISGGESIEAVYAPLPDFENTYSSGNSTRGYWFTAPADFIITGLQVPDESGHGLQNVEVVKFDSGVVPPNWSSSTNSFTSLFRSIGASSGSVIETSIVVHEGDVIGILGAAGDSAMMHNSYGAGPYTSEIAGQSVTFKRMGMQFNLATTPAQNLWTENYNIARVKMFYEVPKLAPLPDFTNTFSSAAKTRGYWFTAPVDFKITGLQVPDETGHGLQNVEVVKFNSGVVPPNWSSTTNSFTSIFRSTGTSSGSIVKTDLLIQAGDVIGILGACGDSSMMHNSYGSGNFSSSIGGNSVTFKRLGMQQNLSTTSAQDLYTSDSSIARVKMFYFAE